MRGRVIWATVGFALVALLALWLVAGRGELRRSAKTTAGSFERAGESGTEGPAAGASAAAQAAAPDAHAPAAARRLRVRVLTAAGPLPGAELRIPGEDVFAATGADGIGELETEDPDVLFVQASKEGYVDAEAALPGGVDEAEIFLVPGTPIRGRVVRAKDGTTVSGAEVHAADRATLDEVCRVLVTDAEGRFTVPGVEPGTPFVVAATFPGFAPAAATGVAGRDAGEIRVVLGRGARVEGTVRGADGKAAEGVPIRVFETDDQFLSRSVDSDVMEQDRLRAAARATTDASGNYSVEGLAPGEHTVLARGTAGATARASFSAAMSDVTRVDLTLEPTGCILVRVVDPAGRPVPRARLELRDAAGEWILRQSVPYRTDGQGEGLATALDPGAYEVTVQPDRWTATQRRVLVERGPPTEVEVRVDPGIALEGTVRDPAGNPVAGVDVTFDARADAQNPHQYKRAVTGRDGRFVLDGLLQVPGKLEIDDWGERWTSWTAESVTPGGQPLSIVVRAAASACGKFEPVPASRHVVYVAATEDGASERDVNVDAEGRFVLTGLDEGLPVTLYFDVPGGCVTRCALAPLGPGERRDLGTLAVAPGRALRGYAKDQDGKPWALTRIGLDYDESGIYKYTLTDGSGRFTFENVDPAAKLSVTVWNAENTGQTFDLDDWSAEPVHELIVERRSGR